jgi:CBS domain-containing protein
LALTACDTADHAGFRARFDSLYELVKDARNDAMHQGAYARHITANATTLAIMLEDTLMIKSKTVADFMVRNVTCAAPWHSIAHIRQLMLASSFSTLPVSGVGDHRWRLVRDHAVAAFIRAADSKSQRTQKLKITLKEAARLDSALELTEAKTCSEHMTVDDALRLLQDNLLLVVLRNEDAPQDSKVTCPEDIMGIITAFDLL